MRATGTAGGVLARTAAGEVRGRVRRRVCLFGGIPYAAPPVGDGRFAPPVPPEPWTGVRDCRSFGPAAPQLPGEGLTNRIPVRWDEDCLTLNVVTPACDDAGRPVYVWIHGGGYTHGQGSVPWYDGTSFATRGDIVVVTVNYRLGALGFSNLGPHLGEGFATAGLNGTLDQVAALGWVRDNIAGFGGDPDRVTVGGESAGAFSVGNLLASPAAEGLFCRAIAQSGAAHHVHGPEAGTAIAGELLAALGNPDADRLRSIPAGDVLAAQAAVIAGHDPWSTGGVDPFYPVWGAGALPGPALDLVSQGAAADVPLLTGTNQDEVSLWGITGFDEDQLHQYAGRMSDDPAGLVDLYRSKLEEADPGWVACAIGSDWVFRIPAVRLAEARHARGADTWMYRFSWDSRAFGGMLGATHALEIPFTFNTLDRPGVDLFIGEGPRPDALASTVHDAWIAFIRGGDPSTGDLGAWPTYGPDSRRVMDLDDACGLVEDPGAEERLAWEGVR